MHSSTVSSRIARPMPYIAHTFDENLIIEKSSTIESGLMVFEIVAEGCTVRDKIQEAIVWEKKYSHRLISRAQRQNNRIGVVMHAVVTLQCCFDASDYWSYKSFYQRRRTQRSFTPRCSY